MINIEILESALRSAEKETEDMKAVLSMPQGCYLDGKIAGMQYMMDLIKKVGEVKKNGSK